MSGADIIARLPKVRGTYRQDVAMSKVTWFGVGGTADVVFKPKDEEDLAQFLRELPKDIPVMVLGVCSNVIVHDGGIRGVVIRLGRDFAGITHEGPTVRAGAAALDVNVARYAAQQGIAGLEFLVGVPGTIGGGIAMNAGAYGAEMADILVKAHAVDFDGNTHVFSNEQMQFSYRKNGLKEPYIFTAVHLRGQQSEKAACEAKMNEIAQQRESTQPIRSKTGGSTFKNPPAQKAWELVDAAGCRGYSIGGAKVSEQHCNFLINAGGATAEELVRLGDEVRDKVLKHSGVQLEWEIKHVGEKDE